MHDDPDANDPAAPLLPKLDRASERLGAPGATRDGPPSRLADEPVESRKLAAIVFVADVLRREVWEEEIDLAPALFDRYPREMPGAPDDFRAAGYQLVDSTRPARRQRCTNCFLSPGVVICARCFGNGRTDEGGVCAYCNGERVVCAACDGAAETVRATLRHVNDRPVAVRTAFFPSVPDTLREVVERYVDPSRPPRESHRVALEANVVESAYRGASAVRAPEFQGHAFGEALDAALAATHELDRYTNVIRREVRAYAWPMLVLRYETSTAADAWAVLLHDADGDLHFLG